MKLDPNELLNKLMTAMASPKGAAAAMAAGCLVFAGICVAVVMWRDTSGEEAAKLRVAQAKVSELQARVRSFDKPLLPLLPQTWSLASGVSAGCGVSLNIEREGARPKPGDFTQGNPHWKAEVEGTPTAVLDCFEILLANVPIVPGEFKGRIDSGQQTATLRVAILGRLN